MTIKCISNDKQQASEPLREYSLTAGESGKLDITVGKKYQVYAKKRYAGYDWYLITTDRLYPLWWIPAIFFEIEDASQPSKWVEDDGFFAYPMMFENGNEEKIIDGDKEAIRNYLKEAEQDRAANE